MIANPQTQQIEASFRAHGALLQKVSFSQDNSRLFLIGDDNSIVIADAGNGTELLRLKGHTSHVTGVIAANDGKSLLSSSYDGTLRRWRTPTVHELAQKNSTLLSTKEQIGLLELAIAFSPNPAPLIRRRVSLLLSTRQWNEAAKGYDQLLEKFPDDLGLRYRRTCLGLKVDDEATYRAMCKELAARIGEPKRPYLADWASKVALILPDPPGDLQRLDELAEIADRDGTASRYHFYFQLNRGMAHYRNEKFESARKSFESAMTTSAHREFFACTPLCRLFLAMSLQKLGEETLASAEWDTAIAEVSSLEPGFYASADHWIDYFMAQRVIKEGQILFSE